MVFPVKQKIKGTLIATKWLENLAKLSAMAVSKSFLNNTKKRGFTGSKTFGLGVSPDSSGGDTESPLIL